MSLANRAPLTAADLRSIFADAAVVPDYFASIGVSTDTRSMEPGNLFVALRGERFDAHEHIYDAMVRGAAGIVIEQRWLEVWNATLGKEFPSFARVVVPDTLVALGQIARHHRRRFTIPLIAVGGANGKTTTKDMIAHILGVSRNVVKTSANHNNRIGTPLTLLQLNARTQAAVIEIGTNEPGEIEVLSAMVEPTHALVTNIGEEHLEKLIDLDGVEREETSLFRWAMEHGATMLVNADDDRLRPFAVHDHARSFATEHDAYLRCGLSFDDELHPCLSLRSGDEEFTAELQVTGYAGGLNAVAAVAVAHAVGVPLPDALTACAGYLPQSSHGYARMVVEHAGALTVLNDCYNANPASVRMALQTLASFPTKARRVAVLGDMRELGGSEHEMHCGILRYAEGKCDMVIAVGQAMMRAAEQVPSMRRSVFSSTADCCEALHTLVHEGDVVLVKASRGMTFEKIIRMLNA